MKTFTDSIFFNDLILNGVATVNVSGTLTFTTKGHIDFVNNKEVPREQPARSKKVVDDYYAFCNKPLEDYITN